MKNSIKIEISPEHIGVDATGSDAEDACECLRELGWECETVTSNGRNWQFDSESQRRDFEKDFDSVNERRS